MAISFLMELMESYLSDNLDKLSPKSKSLLSAYAIGPTVYQYMKDNHQDTFQATDTQMYTIAKTIVKNRQITVNDPVLDMMRRLLDKTALEIQIELQHQHGTMEEIIDERIKEEKVKYNKARNIIRSKLRSSDANTLEIYNATDDRAMVDTLVLNRGKAFLSDDVVVFVYSKEGDVSTNATPIGLIVNLHTGKISLLDDFEHASYDTKRIVSTLLRIKYAS